MQEIEFALKNFLCNMKDLIDAFQCQKEVN